MSSWDPEIVWVTHQVDADHIDDGISDRLSMSSSALKIVRIS
jgi:hypothetical protein